VTQHRNRRYRGCAPVAHLSIRLWYRVRPGPIRRCRRYLRLIDPAARVWFHSLRGEPDDITRTIHRPHHIRRGLIAVFAILVLAVSSTAGTDGIDGSVTVIGPAAVRELSGDTSIRPFKFKASDEALMDLRRRVAATQWPERETVTDTTQGVQLATMQKLARYWGKEYDWRKAEAKLNACPQFITNIDGLDIHFIHVRSKQPNALPVIITHGWPGSIIEQLKIIEPLTNPTAHGGTASDAFDVVIPSLPGYGFSGKPTTTGWDPQRVARAWTVLMKRIGYTRFVAQGGDWG
jgi:hypothetical protein